MSRSALLQSFQVLRRKPMILLLLFPVQAVQVFSMKFTPDMTSMFSSYSILGSMDTSSSFMSSYLFYLLISSLASLLALVASFVLTPPSMELLRDGAAGADTAEGWFMRGLRSHWWKPVVASLILGAFACLLAFFLYFVFSALSVVFALVIGVLSSANGAGSFSSTDMTTIITIVTVIGLGGLIALPLLYLEALFALFLPALADRSFGEAFRLVFSKRGFRASWRAFGAYLLLTLASVLILLAFGAAFVLKAGLPYDVPGALELYYGFITSWAGIFSMLLVSLTVAIRPAFQFCLYRQVQEQEAAGIAKLPQ